MPRTIRSIALLLAASALLAPGLANADRLHVLEAAGPNVYSVAVHSPVSGGNNSAGVAWSTALVNAGLAVTQMAVGTGAGQISSAEAAQVAAGTVLETSFQWQDDPAWTNPQRTADLDTRATQAVADAQTKISARLKYYGHKVP